MYLCRTCVAELATDPPDELVLHPHACDACDDKSGEAFEIPPGWKRRLDQGDVTIQPSEARRMQFNLPAKQAVLPDPEPVEQASPLNVAHADSFVFSAPGLEPYISLQHPTQFESYAIANNALTVLCSAPDVGLCRVLPDLTLQPISMAQQRDSNGTP